ncbi:hypothetical protein, partial [Salmonella enterica]|uniref:hypothetical protein n=1 Tax=Salmonella enterica TaxID=28901 RepID=UPI0020A371E4
MSTELNSGTVGGFGHMGPNDPYNDGHSGSGSSGGSFNGGGNGGHDNSSGSSYTASFGLITGRHPITVPGTKNINSVDPSAIINNIIQHKGPRNNTYLDTYQDVTHEEKRPPCQSLATAGLLGERQSMCLKT